MNATRRTLLQAGAATALGGLPFRSAKAQAANTIRIALLCDFSGTYRDLDRPGRTRLRTPGGGRVQQPRLQCRGGLQADHQNRPDVGSNIARAMDRPRGGGCDRRRADLLRRASRCTTWRGRRTRSSSTAPAPPPRTSPAPSARPIRCTGPTTPGCWRNRPAAPWCSAGGDSWFFITADYAFGHALERDTATFVPRPRGGSVLGAVRTPFPGTTDFSSFLMQAQASRAKVIGLANAGSDTINCIKQAAEFGVTRRRGIKLASLLMFIPDVHCARPRHRAGADADRDLLLGPQRPDPRAYPRARGRTCRQHAALHDPGRRYARRLHYLKPWPTWAPAAAKASGLATVERMKAMP